ncbi:hypothetical protein J8I29_25630 [Labrys sp. LIt4]|uniref:Uncharacterized protein n=1 Tax=Labrys okinawensis TaxID=346911 RepID=A0A2S9Q3W0_9HYPH|nr:MULTISPECIES: hypothetical protein [Labrys]MBP0582732.1 hypothetical protein [Labrys sp. LIt4]PRH84047.1 hypothetical protein C5L14_28635 [Labrys okinawensis]
MTFLDLWHRILDHLPRRAESRSIDKEAAPPDIRIVSLPPSPATDALAEALREVHSQDDKS